MAVRPIDGNELYRIEKLLDTDIVRQDKVALNLLEQVLYDIQHVPTLTQPNEWVSVDENLPDFDVPVLVYVKDIFDNKGTISITKYTITYDLTNNWLGYENSSFKITHWMPLPEPPDRRSPEGDEDK